MSNEVRALEPRALWNNFADLNAVPRPSKKEERVTAFMKAFGESLNLPTEVDHVGNVLVKKPATPGMENRQTVVMQSHIDMVHQKNADTVFDFDTEGIKMLVDGDWVKADGTTLGADNGIGVATIMSILQSSDIAHPAIEALFTIDEETGMTGAFELQSGWMKGTILLNLDTEEDNEIGIGCAGGIDVTATKKYQAEATPKNTKAYKISVTGLNGGHSGMDIIKGLGNANKIMNRLLYKGFEDFGLRISSVEGGSLRNAIPRESFAIVTVDEINAPDFEVAKSELAQVIKSELKVQDPGLHITLQETEVPTSVMNIADQEMLVKSIYAAHNGVYEMSASIPDLVETSNNIAKVTVKDGDISIMCLTRSSVESAKMDLADKLTATFELMGADVECSGSYPGWQPNTDSAILKVMEDLYTEMNGEKPHVAACHAGLECGIIYQSHPQLDMVSFGPNIRGAHSPDEKVQISSVQKYWNYVLEVLKNIPE